MTEPTNPTNPTPQPTPQLTPEEIEILKSMVQGHKAITWLSGRMKGLALWVAAIVGGLVALEQLAGGLISRLLARIQG